MTRFILHVGPHKTGSTYLQTNLFAQRHALETAGYHLASLWNDSPYNPSHIGLVERLVTERVQELRTVFSDWMVSAYQGVIISCDNIASLALSPIQLLMLRELIADAPVTVVYYVRRWSDLLASEWQEQIKQGETYQLLEVLVHNLRDPVKSRLVSLHATLRLFVKLFGKSNIRLVSHSALTEAGVDLFDHFISHFCNGIDIASGSGRRENAALDAPRVELLRIFNTLQRETGHGGNPLLRFFLLSHAPAQMTVLLDHLAGFVRTIEVDDDDRAVRDVLRRNWAIYGSCAVPPVPANRFYAPRQRTLSFIDPGYALSPGFALAARRLWRDLLAIEAPRHDRDDGLPE